MFPLVHIYTATIVSKKRTPLLVIGSVLPDMVWVDRKTFFPEKLHDDINDFYSFLEAGNKDMLDLALGMKLHSNKVGADKYSHFYNGGYSYVKGKELIPDLKRLINSNEDKKISDLSHNFIEAALDLNLQKVDSEILELYKNSLSKVDVDKISKVLSEFSKVDYPIVFKAVQILFNLVNPDDLVSDKKFTKEILPKIIELSFGKDVNSEEVLKILQKAVEISGVDYREFFNEMISEMKKDFPEFS